VSDYRVALRGLLAAGALLSCMSVFAAPTINTGVVVNTQNQGIIATSRINLRAESVIQGGAAPVRIVPGSVQLLDANGNVIPGGATVTEDLCITIDDPEGSFPYRLRFQVTDDETSAPFPPNGAEIILEQGTSQSFPTCKDRAAPVQGPNGIFTAEGVEGVPLGIDVADLLGAVRDPNGDPMTVVSVQNAVGGTVNLAGSTVTFTPNPGASGSNFSFTYTVSDVDGLLFDAPASLFFEDVNNPPEARDSLCLVGVEGGQCALDFNDPDNVDVIFVLVTPPQNGTIDPASFEAISRTIVYTPQPEATTDFFEYRIVDPEEQSSEVARVQITITQDEDAPPTARLVVRDRNGAILTSPDIPDTDGEPGETVILDASSSTAIFPAEIMEWQFEVDGAAIEGSGSAVSVTLTEGPHTLSVVVVDSNERRSAPATLNVTVGGRPNEGPGAGNVVIMINGEVVTTEIFVRNEDFEPGESVTLDATESSDPDGGPLTFEWALITGETANVIAQTATATVRLPDGSNRLRLTITDEDGASASREVIVNVQSDPNLGGMAGLSPNQRGVARAIDELCPRMNEIPASSLTEDQKDLLTRCNNLINADGSSSDQIAALNAMNGEELTTAQRTGINISNLNLSNLNARLTALRGGASGINLAGLNVLADGKRLPLQELAQLAKDLLGSSGGSGGEEEGGGLLDRRLGIFVNGKVGFGEKDRTQNEAGYDLDTWGLTVGADYRFTDRLVAGLAVGYGSSKSKFHDDGGSLESDGYSLSLYGSFYGQRFYVDAIGTYGSLEHDSRRRIHYTLPTEPNPVDLTAVGRADGRNISGGVSAGYNFGSKGWTFGPTFAITFVDVQVDGFAETGAGGLNLQFGEQSAKSLQVQAGAEVSYAMSRKWGVLSPHARVAFVKENEDDAEAILVRFVNDPFVTDLSQPSTTTFLITTDEPDTEFLQWGVGLSALFANGISGFVNYEAFSGLHATRYGEVTLGLRFEREF
jgi:outer membrane autotransporter protein